MSAFAYTRFELVRTFRNVRLLVFTLGFPLILFFTIAAPNRDLRDFAGSGISLPLYYMVGLVGFGTMMALISTGARIATERTDGWTRQLRVTPLSAAAYLRAKVLTGYAMALSTIALLYASGALLGVRLTAERWLEMTGLILVGLLPFAALGVLVGHLLTADTIGPAAGGLVSLLALVSGTWFPLGRGVLHDIAQCLPSYWLVQASHVSLGGGGVAGHGLDRRGRMDGRVGAPRARGVPPRHRARLTAVLDPQPAVAAARSWSSARRSSRETCICEYPTCFPISRCERS